MQWDCFLIPFSHEWDHFNAQFSLKKSSFEIQSWLFICLFHISTIFVLPNNFKNSIQNYLAMAQCLGQSIFFVFVFSLLYLMFVVWTDVYTGSQCPIVKIGKESQFPNLEINFDFLSIWNFQLELLVWEDLSWERKKERKKHTRLNN